MIDLLFYNYSSHYIISKKIQVASIFILFNTVQHPPSEQDEMNQTHHANPYRYTHTLY